MTTMARGLAAPRQAVHAATDCVDTAKDVQVEQTAGRTALAAASNERAALRREYAWVQAAANAAIRVRV